MDGFASWEDRMVEHLREFLVNPAGTVEMPVGEAVEMARAARDFEAILRTAPEDDAGRIAQALRALAAVDIDVVRKVDGELADRLERAVEAIGEVGWRLRATVEGGRVEAVPPPTDFEDTVAAIHRMVGTPREVLLARQRGQRGTAEGTQDTTDK